jgi:adenosine kinase
MRKNSLIVGSIAYDVIFSINGDIRKELFVEEGKIGKVNMMFTANRKQKYFGGTAGNIAYGLGLLDQNPYVFSVVGKDFKQDYQQHLEKLGVNLKLIEKEDGYTATFYGISDEEFQQIGIWQPDVFGEFIEDVSLEDSLSQEDFEDIQVAIFSPGTGPSTRNHMLELRKKNADKVKIIFDPSQSLSISYDKMLLKECLSLTDIMIGNQTEIQQLKSLFSFDFQDIFELGVSYIIETLGEEGSNIYGKSSTKKIQTCKPNRVIETTGAGDAFRAGLIYGLVNDFDIYQSAQIGSYMGAKSVEEMAGQMYTIDQNHFQSFLNTL